MRRVSRYAVLAMALVVVPLSMGGCDEENAIMETIRLALGIVDVWV